MRLSGAKHDGARPGGPGAVARSAVHRCARFGFPSRVGTAPPQPGRLYSGRPLVQAPWDLDAGREARVPRVRGRPRPHPRPSRSLLPARRPAYHWVRGRPRPHPRPSRSLLPARRPAYHWVRGRPRPHPAESELAAGPEARVPLGARASSPASRRVGACCGPGGPRNASPCLGTPDQTETEADFSRREFHRYGDRHFVKRYGALGTAVVGVAHLAPEGDVPQRFLESGTHDPRVVVLVVLLASRCELSRCTPSEEQAAGVRRAEVRVQTTHAAKHVEIRSQPWHLGRRDAASRRSSDPSPSTSPLATHRRVGCCPAMRLHPASDRTPRPGASQGRLRRRGMGTALGDSPRARRRPKWSGPRSRWRKRSGPRSRTCCRHGDCRHPCDSRHRRMPPTRRRRRTGRRVRRRASWLPKSRQPRRVCIAKCQPPWPFPSGKTAGIVMPGGFERQGQRGYAPARGTHAEQPEEMKPNCEHLSRSSKPGAPVQVRGAHGPQRALH